MNKKLIRTAIFFFTLLASIAVLAAGAIKGSDSSGVTWPVACTTITADGRCVLDAAAKFDDDATANCVAITAADVDFTLPGTAGDLYCVSAVYNTAYLNCGTTPSVDHTVGNFSLVVQEGVTKCRRLTGPDCGVIGESAGGFLCFEHMNPAL